MIDNESFIRRQNSVFYFSGREELPKPYTDFYVRMFLDDISRGIVPYSNDGRELTLEGGDDQSERLIAEAVNSRADGGSFEWGVSEFLRLATSEMCAFDEAFFEIAYLENAKTNITEGFVFVHIDDRQIRRNWGRLYQLVPDEEARKRKVETRIALPLENMLIFSLPMQLKRKVRNLRRGLARLSDKRFGASVLEMSGKIPNYNFKDHEKSLNLALAQCCAEVGWDVRGMYRDKSLGYLPIYSFLRWELFQIEIRKAVLDLFNDALDKVRLKIPIKGRIILEDSPTETKIYAALEDLNEGRDSFLKIMDRVNI